MTELVAGVVVAVAALMLVLEPLVRGRPRAVADALGDVDEGDFDFTSVEESESPKIQALLAIWEIEFDRETGKISDEDYATLKASYQKAALAAIDAEQKATDGLAGAADVVVCPSCGPRPESSAAFCSDCGRPVANPTESLKCPKCGVAAPQGAKFCGECGASL